MHVYEVTKNIPVIAQSHSLMVSDRTLKRWFVWSYEVINGFMLSVDLQVGWCVILIDSLCCVKT